MAAVAQETIFAHPCSKHKEGMAESYLFSGKKKKKTRNIFLSIFQLTSQWAESSHTVNLSSRETKKVTLWPLPVSAVQTSKGEKLGMLRASQFQCLPRNRMPENKQTAGTIPALTKLTF